MKVGKKNTVQRLSEAVIGAGFADFSCLQTDMSALLHG